jgi:hypothetical protein
MRELLRASLNKPVKDRGAYVTDIVTGSFEFADAMVKHAGPDPSQYGAAPSRTARGGE